MARGDPAPRCCRSSLLIEHGGVDSTSSKVKNTTGLPVGYTIQQPRQQQQPQQNATSTQTTSSNNKTQQKQPSNKSLSLALTWNQAQYSSSELVNQALMRRRPTKHPIATKESESKRRTAICVSKCVTVRIKATSARRRDPGGITPI